MAKETFPQKFGKYILLEKVATGGMAEIFRSKNIGAAGFEREIAIKRILPHFTEDENFVRMFIDEATIAAKLHHANIVQIFDFDQVDETYFIAMEYVEGKDLKQTMKQARKSGAPIGVWQAVSVIMEVAKALQYAHSRAHKGRPLNIVHRDVSPQNVMLSYSGEVKVMDFGIAKAAERSTKTRAGTVKGKCAYMSPEQARGKPLDQRSDLFALGIILWELLTRKRLFAGETDFETLSNVLKCTTEPASSFNPKVPAELDKILSQVLVKSPDARYPNCGALHRDLSRLFYSNVENIEDVSVGVMMQSLFAEEILASAEAAKEERSDIIQDLVRGDRDTTTDKQEAPRGQGSPARDSVAAIGDGVNDPNLADQDLQETMPLSDMQEEVLRRLKINPKEARENRVSAPVKAKPSPRVQSPITGTYTGVDTRRPMSPLVAAMLVIGVVGVVVAFAFFRSERGGTQPHPAGEITQPATTVFEAQPSDNVISAVPPASNDYALTFVVRPTNIAATLYINGVPYPKDKLTGLRKNEKIKVYAEAQGLRSQEVDVLVSRRRQTVELLIPIEKPTTATLSITAPGATIWIEDKEVGLGGGEFQGKIMQQVLIRAEFAGGKTVTRNVVLGADTDITILPPATTLGVFQIHVAPTTATVEVNGKIYPTNNGVAEVPDLDVGKMHRVRVFTKGFTLSEQTLILEARQQQLEVTLQQKTKPQVVKKKAIATQPAKKKFGFLTINAIPWAQVFYKGKKLGFTPIKKKKFPAGKISLKLKHPSMEKPVTVTLKPGEHKVLKPMRMIPK